MYDMFNKILELAYISKSDSEKKVFQQLRSHASNYLLDELI